MRPKTWMILVLCAIGALLLLSFQSVSSPPACQQVDVPLQVPPQVTVTIPHQQTGIPLQKTYGVPTVDFSTLHIIHSKEEPSFYVLSQGETFPRADGDEAQQYIVSKIGLRERCKEDPSTIVVDIGGFLGDFGLSAAAMGCQVYIFEPNPYQYWLIRGSIALNGFENNCFAYNYAVSSTESILKFVKDGGQTNQVPLLPDDDISNPAKNVFYIHSIPLDTVLPTERIFLLKVDVEGFEPTVLFEGSKKILQEGRVDHLISEYTAWWVEDGKGPWSDFLPKIRSMVGDKPTIFTLGRSDSSVCGPIADSQFSSFVSSHLSRHLQTDVYVDMTGQFKPTCSWGSYVNGQ